MFTPNGPYASVDAAYKDVTTLLASNALDAGQKAGVTITDVVHATPGDDSSPVTAYTITLKGSYHVDMRLGDLQRSARRILTIAMQSEPFQQLAAQQGVTGVRVRPYTRQFGSLPQFVTVVRSRVKH